MFVTSERITAAFHAGRATDATSGAVVTFEGVVRSKNGAKRVTGISYECYTAMAEREIDRIAAAACDRYGATSIDVVHRVGEVPAGEVSLLVTVVAPHRREAFEACKHVIDEMKTRVPIWKKERYDDHTSRWL